MAGGCSSSGPGAVKTRSRACGGRSLPAGRGARGGDGGGAGQGGGRRRRLPADAAEAWNFGPGDVPEAERVRRERARETAAGIVAYSADEACRAVVFALDGRLWGLPVGD